MNSSRDKHERQTDLLLAGSAAATVGLAVTVLLGIVHYI